MQDNSKITVLNDALSGKRDGKEGKNQRAKHGQTSLVVMGGKQKLESKV